jgi:hypothetical protein
VAGLPARARPGSAKAGLVREFLDPANGQVRRSLVLGFNLLQVIAAKDGYQPVAKIARIIKGSSVTLNFSLNKS